MPSRLALAGALLLAGAGLGVVQAPAAQAAGEAVNIWLTTTSDSGGRVVTRGLQPQTPIAFAASSPAGNQTVTVNENTTYQQFEGGGASFTDTAAWLMNSSGALTPTARDAVMRKLFDPVDGIGLAFLRNPMGASDLARYNYSYDDTCCDLGDFSIAHDLADVLPLTKQAKALNTNLKVMAVPWSAPAWMKDNNSFVNQGWLKSEYYPMYAQYFVKYVQAYQAQGVKTDYVSVSNEPNCCGPGTTYASMNWNGSGLAYFMKNNLWPAFRDAGITAKTLVLDWNWGDYNDFGSVPLSDSAIRSDPLFGGIAWHGYGGDVNLQTTVHNQYPSINHYMTEHSGGTWIANQQTEDMLNLVDYTRNWDRSWVKWSLAVDQNYGPHAGGCDKCTGLITVHNGDARHGQVDYTIEYYTMGHLTKFVKPGAYRIDSTANSSVPNVAWKNPDGSKALIAYNNTGGPQSVKVNWGGQSFTYTLPTKTSATFTWAGTQSGGGGGATAITGYGGKCVDVAGAGSANGTQVQLWTCNGTAAQQWTVGADGTIRALGKCLDVAGGSSANGTKVQIYDCNGTAAQTWTVGADGTIRALGKCLDATGVSSADGTPLQIWDCSGGANQRWTV
ncbi:ricin-type beta-trefoil lectin domain protein [Planotetraspora sp. A-T 1434]|uniref:ricin-type beta-trefoil lectin domain protein n=1 Tax=Planotetraspora sp. A-T 1434 TaxID=2979219 RepID=UPI0021BE8D2A|nr:ricin-type beta-trefoil lectin domain protein [Planotetraspora sp. A-T 1434]MCT9930814.1 ricin-type beta-trefoil lectin domain protein [Planotetraspora sp. A-T 1434]